MAEGLADGYKLLFRALAGAALGVALCLPAAAEAAHTDCPNGTLGTGGSDSFNGGDGGNEYGSLDGWDTANGNGGDDMICGDDGNDDLSGGAQSDVLNGDWSTTGDGPDTIHGGTNTLVDIIDGNGKNDSLYGDDGTDLIDGQQGNDLIVVVSETTIMAREPTISGP